MSILTGMGVSAKYCMVESMKNDTFKLALYGSDAALSPLTEAYTTRGEVRGKGYPAGGVVLTGFHCEIQTTSVTISWDSPVVLKNATISAYGAMIYNATKGCVMAVVDFGEEIRSTNGNLTLRIPRDIVRIS